MLNITLGQILDKYPCSEGWGTLLSSLPPSQHFDAPFPISHILQSNGLEDTLWALRCLPATYIEPLRMLLGKIVANMGLSSLKDAVEKNLGITTDRAILFEHYNNELQTVFPVALKTTWIKRELFRDFNSTAGIAWSIKAVIELYPIDKVYVCDQLKLFLDETE